MLGGIHQLHRQEGLDGWSVLLLYSVEQPSGKESKEGFCKVLLVW